MSKSYVPKIPIDVWRQAKRPAENRVQRVVLEGYGEIRFYDVDQIGEGYSHLIRFCADLEAKRPGVLSDHKITFINKTRAPGDYFIFDTALGLGVWMEDAPNRDEAFLRIANLLTAELDKGAPELYGLGIEVYDNGE